MSPPRFGASPHEQAADALNQSKKAAQDIAQLKQQVAHLRCISEALWSLVGEQLHLDENLLRERISLLKAREENSQRQAEACPACHRALQEHSRACIYCGTLVEKRDLFKP